MRGFIRLTEDLYSLNEMNSFDFLDKSFYMVMGAVALFLVADFLWHQIKVKNKGLQKVRERKYENKKKILKFLANKEKITNDDVRELLAVSDTTAFRYLEELENKGKIKQVGKTGRSVFYTK